MERSVQDAIGPRIARARSGSLLLGPAFVAAIAYVDPGNVASNKLVFEDLGPLVGADSNASKKARGVEAIVVLIHEGGLPTGDYNDCPDISGPIVDIVRKFETEK